MTQRHRSARAGQEEDPMVCNAVTPWTRNVEPAIDRFFARAMDVPVWSAGADVEELEDRAVIRLEVPGVRPEQVGVSVEHRTLTVKVEREGKGTFTRQYTIGGDRKSTRLNSSHVKISYAVFCLKKK